eukprot:COSAG02_NODE_41475_length_394_cov_0.871186_1_plen_71_part_10
MAIYSFWTICGAAFDSIVRDDFNSQFHDFEQRCLSDADPLAFLDAIMVRCRSSCYLYLLLTGTNSTVVTAL